MPTCYYISSCQEADDAEAHPIIQKILDILYATEVGQVCTLFTRPCNRLDLYFLFAGWFCAAWRCTTRGRGVLIWNVNENPLNSFAAYIFKT